MYSSISRTERWLSAHSTLTTRGIITSVLVRIEDLLISFLAEIQLINEELFQSVTLSEGKSELKLFIS